MSDSEDHHAASIAAAEHLCTVMRHMIDVLEDELKIGDQVITELAARRPIREVVTSSPIGEARERLTDAIVQLEAARAEARRRLFAHLAAEGVGIGEISRVWGVSRQLVSRIARETREGATPETERP